MYCFAPHVSISFTVCCITQRPISTGDLWWADICTIYTMNGWCCCCRIITARTTGIQNTAVGFRDTWFHNSNLWPSPGYFTDAVSEWVSAIPHVFSIVVVVINYCWWYCHKHSPVHNPDCVDWTVVSPPIPYLQTNTSIHQILQVSLNKRILKATQKDAEWNLPIRNHPQNFLKVELIRLSGFWSSPVWEMLIGTVSSLLIS